MAFVTTFLRKYSLTISNKVPKSLDMMS